jgi:hypothetical protein
MRARRCARAPIAAAAVLAAAALVLAGCGSGGPASSSSTSTSTRTRTPTHATTKTTVLPFTHPTIASTTSTAPADKPQNLVATDAVKAALVAAYVAHAGLPADQVAGTAPNSVFYAYVPPTNTYWAIAAFVPVAHASTPTLVAMQDDGCCGVFTMTPGAPWTYVTGFLGKPCPGQIPARLEELWELVYPTDCSAASATATPTG